MKWLSATRWVLLLLSLLVLAASCATVPTPNVNYCRGGNDKIITAPAVVDALKQVRLLEENDPADVTAAITRLDQVITDCGRLLTGLEKARVYEMRGRLRARANDIDGAIDDLNVALAEGALPIKREHGLRAFRSTLEYADPSRVAEPQQPYGFSPDRDAQPLVRVPPQYPEKCLPEGYREDSIKLKFDVTPDGQTKNIRIVESTNRCLNESAINSIKRWKYQPKTKGNKAIWRRGVEVVITFNVGQ